MDKLKYIKLENPDGSYSDSIPLTVDSDHIDIGETTLTDKISTLATKKEMEAIASGSPLIANSIEEMADTDRIYVNVTNGHWYWYNNNWQDGGVYQAVKNANDSITPAMTTFMKISDSNLWLPESSSKNNVTLYLTDDYETKIVGVSNQNTYRRLIFKVHLKAGRYAIRCFDYSGTKPTIYGHKTDSSTDIVATFSASAYGTAFTLNEESDIYFKTYEVINVTYDYSGKIVLTEANSWQDITYFIKPYYRIKNTNIVTDEDIATYSKNGIVKPDGDTILINNDGTISINNMGISLQGKKLSICGVSVDTYKDYIPNGNATYYSPSNLPSVNDTWWKKVLNKTGMELLVNNSWSGATATTKQNLDSSGVQRCILLDDGESNPDFIIVGSFGLNDWAKDNDYGNYNIQTQLPSINDDLSDPAIYDTYKSIIETYEGAIATMFKRMQEKYPNAKILAMDMYNYYRSGKNPMGDNNKNAYLLNKSLYKVAEMFGIQVIKISTCGINSSNSRMYCVEGLSAGVAIHPNAEGHTMLYREVMKELNKYMLGI